MRQCFIAQMNWNTPRDPQIPPDAKAQVRHNMSRRTFYGNDTGSTQALKIGFQRFTPRTHQKALRDPQIPVDAKTQVQGNVS
jgi:hypothetical protein